jgi:hypothetical protein
MDAVLADRAEQRFGESAMSAVAHHQEICIVGGIDQHLRGIALDGAGAHPDGAGPTALLIAMARVFSEFSLNLRPSSMAAGAHP